jgi:hypothetical protein
VSVWEHPDLTSVFRCRQCGECCRGGEAGIKVSAGEARSLAACLDLEPAEFLARFCLESGGRVQLRRAEGRCLLWGEDGCRAWGVKPRVCSLWPFPPGLLEDAAGLAAVRASCPGLSPTATLEELERAHRLVAAAYPPK